MELPMTHGLTRNRTYVSACACARHACAHPYMRACARQVLCVNWEDPTLFVDKRGHFHVLAHAFRGQDAKYGGSVNKIQ